MSRSFVIVALATLGASIIGCADTATNPRLDALRKETLSGGKVVHIDALVVKNGQIQLNTSAGEIHASSLLNGTETLLGVEACETATAMNVTVPSGASLVLQVLPFANTTLITWFEGPEASGPELSMANPYTVPFGSLLSDYTADCALNSAGGSGGGGGGGGLH